jgi:brachyury protein
MKGCSKSVTEVPPVQLHAMQQSANSSNCPISVELEDSLLWDRFQRLTNEMIVTKNGRRMFPVIKVRISGLEPNAFYTVLLEFRQIENNRWKYINGEWLPGEKASLRVHGNDMQRIS